MGSPTTTEAQLCSQALLNIGQRQTIDDLDEGTEEAEVCKQWYGHLRDALLESFPWKFATRRAVLAEVANASRSGWGKVYALPADCITPRSIYAGTRMPPSLGKIPFDVESDDTNGRGNVTGAVLLTDQSPAELIYTSRVESVALFSPLFVEALAWQVSVKLCLALPIKPDVAKMAAAAAAAAFLKAGAAQFRGSQPDTMPESDFITGR